VLVTWGACIPNVHLTESCNEQLIWLLCFLYAGSINEKGVSQFLVRGLFRYTSFIEHYLPRKRDFDRRICINFISLVTRLLK
jgi:hypothetical protein